MFLEVRNREEYVTAMFNEIAKKVIRRYIMNMNEYIRSSKESMLINRDNIQELVRRIEEDKRIKDQFFIQVFWERMTWEVYEEWRSKDSV